jgi:hypothetical protein
VSGPAKVEVLGIPVGRRFLIGVAIVVGVMVLGWLGLAALVILPPMVEDYSHRVPFDDAKWRTRALDQDPDWPTRLRMVDDLISRKILDGLSRTQVEALLGPPENNDETGMIYRLGPQRGGMRLDDEMLTIQFDDKGRVAGCKIWQS